MIDRYSSDSDSSEDTRIRKTLNLSYMPFHPDELQRRLENVPVAKDVKTILLFQSQIRRLPSTLLRFSDLRYLDISSNNLTAIPEIVCSCPLRVLIAKSNQLSEAKGCLPSNLSSMHTLRELNLGANQFNTIPDEILQLPNLHYLYMGANQIKEIPHDIVKLQSLELISVAGNRLRELPASLGYLKNLCGLVVCDNQLQSIPTTIAKLTKLKTLLLHRNQLKMLPIEIVALNCLTELSLRENPLVDRFVSRMMHSVPTLVELAARTVKLHNMQYSNKILPKSIVAYLSSAHHCINPKCKGVYFDSRVEHVKFKDFCGKYRVPLLHYLCSVQCISDEDDCKIDPGLLRKVLLG